MPKVVSVESNTVRNAVSAARKVLGVQLKDSREIDRSYHGDGLYRCTLSTGDIVEVTINPGKSSAHIVQELQ